MNIYKKTKVYFKYEMPLKFKGPLSELMRFLEWESFYRIFINEEIKHVGDQIHLEKGEFIEVLIPY